MKADDVFDKIQALLRHFRNVEENCLIIANYLIEEGKVEMALQLIARGRKHDISKLAGMEWELLNEGNGKLELGIKQHSSTNDHHPEFWGSIEEMPQIAIAEMVADWKSRSEEFGTSVRDWVNGGAMERFKYKKNSRVHKEILYFLDMLCDKPFKQ